MIFQSHSPQDMTSNAYSRINMPHQMHACQLKIVSFNIWDLPYWFVKNRKQRILQIAEYLQRLDAEIIWGAFGHSDVSRSRCRYRINTWSSVPLYLAQRSANI
jgi:hypothetical protein